MTELVPVEHDPFSGTVSVEGDPFKKSEPAPTQNDPVPAEATRVLNRAADRGISDTLGSPVDVVNKGLKKLGLPVSSEPFGGSKSMRDAMRYLGMVQTEDEPKTKTGKAIEGANEGGTSALLSGGASGATLKAGGKILGSEVLQGTGKAIAAPVANTAVGAGAGAAESAFDDPMKKGIAGLVGGTTAGMFAPGASLRTAREAPNVLDAYERLKLAPSAAEAGLGGKSAAWVQSNVLPQTIGGSNVMERFKQQRQQELSDIQSSIAESFGSPKPRAEMGKSVQDNVMDAWIEAKARSGAVVGNIADKYATDIVYPENFIKAVTNPRGAATSSTVREQTLDPMVTEAAAAIRANGGHFTMADLAALKGRYGRAMEPGFQKNVNDAQVDELYGALRKDMEGHVKTKSPEDYRALKDANEVYSKAMTDFKQSFKKLIGTRDVPVSSERAYDIVTNAATEGGRADLREFKTVWDTLPKAARGDLSATILTRMGATEHGAQASPESFSLAKFLKGYNGLSLEAKDILFASNQKQAQALDDLAAVAKHINDKMVSLASTSKSGTGALQMGQMAAGVAATAAVGNPTQSFAALATMLATVGGPYVAAEMLTNPTAVKAMTGILNGVNLAIDSGARASILLESLPKILKQDKHPALAPQ